MKTDKTYKMSKPTKIYLNSILNDDEKKQTHKELFIEAEFHSSNAKKKMMTKMIVEIDEE